MKEKCVLDIRIDRTGSRPLFLTIVDAIINEIERGRLRPGDVLPGARTFASNLRVNRNTIDMAFHELIMQGWVVTEPSRGTFVSVHPPITTKKDSCLCGKRAEPPVQWLKTPTIISDGIPDPRLLPTMEFAREFRRSLSSPIFLAQKDYPNPRGSLYLRNAIVEYLQDERGLVASTDELLVTSGSQMALYLTAMAVIQPGDVIAVEDPGYPLARAAFLRAGARVVGVPVDASGLDVDYLETVASQEPRLKAIYVTPHRQYPTTVTLEASRRVKLLDLAKRHQFIIIEDDYDHEYTFIGPAILPLAARAGPDHNIVYIGSFSKILASSIRIGYVIASRDLILIMAHHRDEIDRGGTTPIEHAIANLITDGEMRRHLRKIKKIYEDRKHALIREINHNLHGVVDFTIPNGGLAFWLKFRAGISAVSWAKNAEDEGVVISPGVKFFLNTESACEAFRIGFANFDAIEMRNIIQILAKTIPKQEVLQEQV